MMEEVITHPLRLGPFAVLVATCLWLLAATRRVSREIGGSAYGFGGTSCQLWAQRLFRASVVGALLSTLGDAIHLGWMGVDAIAIVPEALIPVGMVMAVAGSVSTVVARSDMGRRWRVGVPEKDPDALVTTGLVALSRNPVFVGMLTLAAGLVLALPSPLMVASALGFWLACEMQLRDEERFLESAFGASYADYRRRVRRWL
ncbi:isoprenylcysteine carboxylmethyltransferase family protein [Aureimonas sp. SA4125]|uniref:methyltransferase family protein n=1 Tax=Aureimonas sp. SA4125 TaxID=2826993 RepID=UPI001CC7FF57|nr:isoprenylcysteine carboxylmethyltransferase family protein [Aureimonas sp. SA4125]